MKSYVLELSVTFGVCSYDITHRGEEPPSDSCRTGETTSLDIRSMIPRLSNVSPHRAMKDARKQLYGPRKLAFVSLSSSLFASPLPPTDVPPRSPEHTHTHRGHRELGVSIHASHYRGMSVFYEAM